MNINEVLKRINENTHLLVSGGVTEIERDILLHDLRTLYTIVKATGAGKVTEYEQPLNTVVEIVAPLTITEPTPVVTITEQQKPIIEEIKTQVPEPEKVIEVEETFVAPQPAPVTEVKTKAGSLNDVFAGEERSLNERLSGDKRPAINDSLGGKDLKSMIDFNKQFVLTNELFGGDSHAFQTAVKYINDAPNIEAAFEYIKTELLPKYKWNGDMQSARLFDKLIRQKFGL